MNNNSNFILLLFGCFALLMRSFKADLKIEVMKEGLLDLKTTILRSPNITEFAGSAEEPYIGGTFGELLPFSPIDGCNELKEFAPFTMKDEKTGKLRFSTVNGKSDQVIVLIARGGCPFNVKFKNAMKIKGVTGVLVYNGPNDTLPNDKIELTNDSDDLPGFLISNSLGLELYNKMIKYRGGDNNNSLKSAGATVSSAASSSTSIPYIEIIMTPVSIDATNRANSMIQMALIAIIIILALSFGASIVIHMRSPSISTNPDNPNSNDRNGNPLEPIDVEFLQKLPLKTYKGRRKSTDSNSKGQQHQQQQEDNNISKSSTYNNEEQTQSQVTFSATGYSGIKSPTVTDDEKGISPKHHYEQSQQQQQQQQLFSNEWFEMIKHEWPMNDSCPICLDEFNSNEVLNELPCGHCYHIACIQPWLQYRSPCCPLCKLDVREEFKKIPKVEPVENVKRSKLKTIWSKLILKSSRTDTSTTTTSATTTAQPSMSTTISMTELSNTISIPQIPQRALITDTDNTASEFNNNNNNFNNNNNNNVINNHFHSIPL